MRPAIALGAVAAIGVLSLAVLAGGRHILNGQTSATARDAASSEAVQPAKPAAAPAKPRPSGPSGPAAQKDTATASLDGTGLERVEPREPLSTLGQALPPPTAMPDDWEGTTLYRPVATAAGLFQAMGRTVTVAGTEIVDPDETCSFEGKSWPCGISARTAFRSFLRGRAITCAVPPEADRDAISADCRIGKQDVGAWLVSNGWARPAANGPYAEAGKEAQSAAKGIFGPPPQIE